jgi:membrane protease YdiL (CAAX protease family)
MPKIIYMLAIGEKAVGKRLVVWGCWREVLFWMLLLPTFSALESTAPRRQAVGLLELSCFLLVSISSLGRLRNLGLEFVAWERISWRAAVRCVLWGISTAAGAVLVSKFSHQQIGLTLDWNKAMLIVLLGPVLEEIVCRGYVLALLLYLAKRTAWSFARSAAVITAAVIFAAAHVGNPGITWLQLSCIVAMGCLYGALRLNYRSTAAAVLTHSTYNLALCLSSWLAM